MKKFLLNEADRRELAAMLSQQKSAPPPHPNATPQKVVHEEGDSYWALPPCETGLPAAEMIDGKLVTIGIQCCLYRHSWLTEQMEPMLDQAGLPVRVTVFNYYQTPEIRLVQVYKHKDGSWTNERPFDRRQITDVTTTPNPVHNDPACEGECYWQADSNGVWQNPTGSCQNVSTTTTTTATPSTPGTTRYPPSPATTVSPCIANKCTLICVDTSTTPAPDEYGVPVPYQRFRYALKDGSVCPTGCTCYGLGDPCFLVDGELVSNCIGAGTSTTTTSTPAPDAPVCDLASFVFGTVPPLYYRAAIRREPAGSWTVCGDCDDGKTPMFPLGGDAYRQHDYPRYPTVYESPCVDNPCANSAISSEATFSMRAYPHSEQIRRWGWYIRGVFYDYINKKFLANWFVCKNCEGANRPNTAPPIWIYEDQAKNEANGVFFDEGTNTYVFDSSCIQGFNCTTCGRAPTRRLWEYQGPDSGAPPTTTNGPTSTTTTTLAPDCGCSRPNFCPQPYECIRTVCSREHAEVFPVHTTNTTVPPPSSLPCFPSNTTTSGPTTTGAPTTTNAPNQCYDSYGTLCNCSTTTSTPSGSTCPPGSILVTPTDPCLPPYCEGVAPTTAPPPPPVTCTDVCTFQSRTNSDGITFRWELLGACTSLFQDLQLVGDCACSDPVTQPTECNQITYTPCYRVGQPTTTPTPPPCSCCQTTVNPCLTKSCRYGANGTGGWTLRSNSCPTSCPCPPASSITVPSIGCDTLTIACGGSPPTQPPTSTTSTTTACPSGSPGPSYKCCFRYQGQQAGFWSCAAYTYQCECAVGRPSPQGPPMIEAYATTDTDCSTGGACGSQTTTPTPGACCVTVQVGTAAPTIQCFNVVSEASCNGLNGTFQAGANCSSNPCASITTTVSPTTTAGPTTTTTTNNPAANCCFGWAVPPYCVLAYGSSACLQQGGSVIANCNSCGPNVSTTTTSTTTAGPGTTTTPNPCDSCWAFNCGCPTGPIAACPPGETFDCGTCTCVAETTSPPTAPPTAPP